MRRLTHGWLSPPEKPSDGDFQLLYQNCMVCRDVIFLNLICDDSAVPLVFVWCVCVSICLCAKILRSSLATTSSSASLLLPPFLGLSHSIFPSFFPLFHNLSPLPPFILILHSFLFIFWILSSFAIHPENTRPMFVQCIIIYKEISWTLFYLTQ